MSRSKVVGQGHKVKPWKLTILIFFNCMTLTLTFDLHCQTHILLWGTCVPNFRFTDQTIQQLKCIQIERHTDKQTHQTENIASTAGDIGHNTLGSCFHDPVLKHPLHDCSRNFMVGYYYIFHISAELETAPNFDAKFFMCILYVNELHFMPAPYRQLYTCSLQEIDTKIVCINWITDLKFYLLLNALHFVKRFGQHQNWTPFTKLQFSDWRSTVKPFMGNVG